jgi:hypothetical protein
MRSYVTSPTVRALSGDAIIPRNPTMSHTYGSRPFGRILASLIASTLAMMVVVGCSSKKVTNPPPVAGSTTYTGSVSGATTSGKLSITVDTSSPAPQNAGFRARGTVTATGTFTPSGGAAIALTGAYDDVAKTCAVTGSGWSFGGGLTSFGLEGLFSGPAGATGVFSLQTGTTGVTVVIGTFTSTTGGVGGRFNFSISGTTVHGNAVATDASVIPLDGTYTAATGAVSIVHPAGGNPLATGTYNASTGAASGTFDDQNGNSGNWTGQKQP